MKYYMTVDSDPELAYNAAIHASAMGSIGGVDTLVFLEEYCDKFSSATIWREDHIPDGLEMMEIPERNRSYIE